MANEWANQGLDLHLDTGPDVPRGTVRARLMAALREAVRSGRLAPGTRLPSSRQLAADLGLARNTVADAYAELVAEGWLTARQGSGTRVAARTAPVRRQASRPRRSAPLPVHDLRPGSPDLTAFPRAAWLRAARQALDQAPASAFGWPGTGREELRTALAEYLARVRGVRADPGRILVTAGFTQGLRQLLPRLRERGVRTVAVESYGLWVHWEVLREAGMRVVVLPFDADGTVPVPPPGTQAVLLTPSHQFPTGGALLPERRAALVDWARAHDGLVLEDDYDGEFRYDRQPVGALQGLDPERVVHLGTTSKSLATGLRLGWAVLPAALATGSLAPQTGWGGTTWEPGVMDQLTFAAFLRSGAYDRHVRAMRLRYRRRRDALVAAVAARAPGVGVSGIAAGLHAVLRLPPGSEPAVLRAAAWERLALTDLGGFRHPDAGLPPEDALVVGYATPPEHAWPSALEALCRVLP
ncbi:PLP-dependent aminotransferase family protein [Streptomyces sp. NPDC004959]|uniref:MocR-like pyridoxine biosynthesis transcription factor PdxR n=1 Tax=Streptomyces sp. NPDC004959 TaxID=3154673 RepID=UPI0033AA6A93